MTKIEECCIKWLNENYGLMEIFTVNDYVDSVFHMKNGKCILEYNKTKGVVHVNYSEIWVFFEFYFNMNCTQIQYLTKLWVEKYYEMKHVIIKPDAVRCFDEVEVEYKMRNISTRPYLSCRGVFVEDVLFN
jgi:hypothetical protein